jgi:hypothetical protein
VLAETEHLVDDLLDRLSGDGAGLVHREALSRVAVVRGHVEDQIEGSVQNWMKIQQCQKPTPVNTKTAKPI